MGCSDLLGTGWTTSFIGRMDTFCISALPTHLGLTTDRYGLNAWPRVGLRSADRNNASEEYCFCSL